MVRIDIRMGLALLALVALTPPAAAAAEEQGSDWLGAVTDFVRDGLGPARTIEDIRREEERARQAAAKAAETPPKVDQAVVAPAPVPVPAPVVEAEPVVAPVVAAPLAPAPVVAPPVRAAALQPVPPEARPQPKPAAIALPLPEARPAKPPVPVAARVPTPPPPPEPLSSRIAATATLDQAMKLGGSAETYGQRLRKPVRN